MSARASILHLSSSRVFGGAEEHVRTLLAHMDSDRFRCAVALPAGGDFDKVLSAHGIPTHDVAFASKWDLGSRSALVRIVREHGYAIIHSHNRREDLFAALAARATEALAVTTIHDRINMDQQGRRVRNLSARIYNRMLWRSFAKIITVSEATRADVIDQTRVDASAVVHVVNGVDLARLERALPTNVARKRLNLRADTQLVGIIARVRGENIGKKGHRYLFDAFGRIHERFPKARLVVVGEDEPARAFLERLARDARIGDRVTFLGYRDDVVEVASAFDVLAVPSLFEGLPRALMDAMLLGKCVVASAVDGIAEIVEEGASGLLAPPADAGALADALEKALADEALRRRLGSAARQIIQNRYSGSLMADGTAGVYDALLGDGS